MDIAQVRGVFGDIYMQYVQLVYGDFEGKKPAFLESTKNSLDK